MALLDLMLHRRAEYWVIWDRKKTPEAPKTA
jgi:hypothetical protein